MNVTLLNHTPDAEEQICIAARNDYSEDPVSAQSFEELMEDIEGDSMEEKQRTLMTHLMQHGHFGPFEHPHLTFSVEGVSRSLMAQLTRHRHVSFDIQSMRYVSFDDIDPDEEPLGEIFVIPPSATDHTWVGRNQSASDFTEEDAARREELVTESYKSAIKTYQELLELGMPPEDARYVLPIGTQTNIVFTLNIRMLMHVADMRAAADAQWEIRNMTEELLELAEEVCPITFDIYNEEMKNRKNRLAP